MNPVYTIGHSTMPFEAFSSLLREHRITAIADVRSLPYSRHCPQFTQAAFRNSLANNRVAYVFLGQELGARPSDPSVYSEGRVHYDRLAETPYFVAGLERVITGRQKFTIALTCAEHDPITCHRAILVARHLRLRGVEIRHILSSGRLEPHESLEDRLLAAWKLSNASLFLSRSELLAEAYAKQEDRIAWRGEAPSGIAERNHVSR